MCSIGLIDNHDASGPTPAQHTCTAGCRSPPPGPTAAKGWQPRVGWPRSPPWMCPTRDPRHPPASHVQGHAHPGALAAGEQPHAALLARRVPAAEQHPQGGAGPAWRRAPLPWPRSHTASRSRLPARTCRYASWAPKPAPHHSAVACRCLLPRPQDGNWSDVSGENFLRTLLTQPIEQISGSFSDEEPQFANASPVGGDPRLVAQRIMDYR